MAATSNHPQGTSDSNPSQTRTTAAERPGALAELGVSLGFLTAGLAVIALGWLVMFTASARLSPDPVGDARRAALQLRLQLIADADRRGPAMPLLPLEVARHGRDVFFTTCITCHGPDGMGKPGLGKSLVLSDFVAAEDDAALLQMISTGRPADHPLNTTKVPMPPKGGNLTLAETDLAAVVQYVRALQDPRRMPELPAFVPPKIAPPTAAEKEAALAAAGGDAELASYIASGTKLYGATCIACHGAGGAGMKGNGKPLATSDFARKLDDDALLAFIKRGRAPGEEGNTTGIAMPPKGGNPALSDDDLLDIIAYLRSIQGITPTNVNK